jgi:probable HAF family extracellular repeat protein
MLGTLPGQQYSKALDINDLGQVVGSSGIAQAVPHLIYYQPQEAFLWQNGVMVGLGHPAGYSRTEAVSVNNAGQVVCIADPTAYPNYVGHPFLWDNGVWTDLGYPSVFKANINDHGQIAITTSTGHSYLLTPLPAVSSVVVNGGPIVTRDSFGNTPNLVGQNSVVEQLLVTFNEHVTLDPGAFSIVNLANSVSVASGITPNTLPASVTPTAVPGSANRQFVLTFSGAGTITLNNTATGAGGVGNVSTRIKDGFYQLHIDGTKVHANGLTAVNNDTNFWALFGANNPADIALSPTLGNGASVVTVASGGISDIYAAFNSQTNVAGGPPFYNPAYDFNLDGAIDGTDVAALDDEFNTEWSF